MQHIVPHLGSQCASDAYDIQTGHSNKVRSIEDLMPVCMQQLLIHTHSDLDDLFDVQKELNSVSAKWKNIGIALHLKPNTLDGINAYNNSDPTTCLTSVITEWLKRNYNVERFGEPTWRWLVEAVDDPSGGANAALAMDIATRHKVGGMPTRYIHSAKYVFGIFFGDLAT